jgi:hypothetical protein
MVDGDHKGGMAMPAVAAIGVAATVASTAYSAYSANKTAGAMQDSADAQTALAQAQWNRYLTAFAPLEDKLIKQAQTPARQDPGFLRMMGGVNQRYGNASAETRRMMGGRYQYGGGLEGQAQRSLEMNRVRDIDAAEGDWEANRLNRMYQVAGLGRNLPTQAMAGYNSAGNMYGNMAQMAGQNMAGFGGGIGNMFQMWQLANMNNAAKPGASAYAGSQATGSLY